MADIQPKNTTTIRVDKVKEKTTNAGITLYTGGADRVVLDQNGDLEQDATNGGNILWTKSSTGIAQSVSAAVTAAGSAIGDATDLTAVFNNVTTVGASEGVQLWDAPVGVRIEVVNNGANALAVYPHDGSGTLNGGVAGAAVSLATEAIGIFVRASSTDWIAREVASTDA